MAYVAEGIDGRAEVLLNGNDSLVYFPKADGAKGVPDAATAFITIIGPGGQPLLARAAAVITGSKLSYTQAWAEASYPLDMDYEAVWEWQVGGVAFTDRQYFDVVRNKLPCLIDTDDLLEEYPNLTKHLTAIGETDASKFIKRAWSELLDSIRAGGNRPALVTDKQRLINPALQLALSKTCNALAREATDIWSTRAKVHMKRWSELYGQLGDLEYDVSEDGLPDVTARISRNRMRV